MASTPKWNEIPFDSNAEPEVKAQEFDLQYEENGGGREVDNNPYSDDNFPGPDRRQ